jgi:hypothetical protein
LALRKVLNNEELAPLVENIDSNGDERQHSEDLL